MYIGDYDAELARAGANIEGRLGGSLFLIRRHPLGAIGAAIMAVFALMALLAEFVAGYDPLAVNSSMSLAPPSATHWMGADSFGRESFSA